MTNQTRTITVRRTYTIIVEGDVTEEEYIALSEDLQDAPLDTRDAGDATGAIIECLGQDMDGETVTVNDRGGMLSVSWDDAPFEWNPPFPR